MKFYKSLFILFSIISLNLHSQDSNDIFKNKTFNTDQIIGIKDFEYNPEIGNVALYPLKENYIYGNLTTFKNGKFTSGNIGSCGNECRITVAGTYSVEKNKIHLFLETISFWKQCSNKPLQTINQTIGTFVWEKDINGIITLNKEKNGSTVNTIKERDLGNYPDENATIKFIYTSSMKENKDLILRLEKELKKEKFKIEEKKSIKQYVYNNCKDNLLLKIKGNGITRYYLKRQEAKPEKYYPDFFMWVYEFNTEEESIGAEQEIQKAFSSANSFCNGKSPYRIVRYKNKIIHLGTRAEMFRDYIDNFAEKISTYNQK